VAGTERRPRLIFVTQLLDPNDPVVGFLVPQLEALADACERLIVIANEVRGTPASLEAHSLGKERRAGRARRALRYQRLVRHWARALPADAILAHMSPLYLILAAPVVPRSTRRLLWFAHPGVTRRLRVAERLADQVLTILPGSFPLSSPKVRAIGQAIDLDRFRFDPRAIDYPPLRIVSLGRTSPIKGFDTALRAVAQLRDRGVDVSLRVVGPSTTAAEIAHREELRQAANALGVAPWVSIEDGRSPEEVPALLADADVTLNAIVAKGGADKVVFESMASGRLAITSNQVFAPLLADLPLDLTFPPGDAVALALRLASIVAAPQSQLDDVACELRRRVEVGHSLAHWVDQIVGAASAGSGGALAPTRSPA
jgi:glycosyltransferase involved in cell wall biosynthesis